MKKIKGNFVILTALMATALVGVGALSLDLGRLFVLRSEMQNAADAAALAAAAELTGAPGARANAEAAARFLLQHDSRFADIRPLLGDAIRLEFFCTIGSRYDPNPAEATISDFCSNGEVDGRRPAANDREASYARVLLEPADTGDAYSIALFFLPVLNAALDSVQSRTFLSARATGGQHFFACNFPPLLICNPFESQGLAFKDVMPVGGQLLFQGLGGSSSWAPGNFGWMENPAGSGAPNTAAMLANETLTGCTRPRFTTSQGSTSNVMSNALNTRYGIWSNPQFDGAASEAAYRAAPNILAYPRDATFDVAPVGNNFGRGDWNRNGYFSAYHDWQTYGRPANWATMTRWETYMWELWGAAYQTADPDAVPAAPHQLPSRNPRPSTTQINNQYDGQGLADPGIARNGLRQYHGIPRPSWLNNGSSTGTLSNANRRSMVVAVVNCQAQAVRGNFTFTMVRPEGFARFFITEQSSGPPDNTFYLEYTSWTGDAEGDDNFFVESQLYE
jgi:hypothetical protein